MKRKSASFGMGTGTTSLLMIFVLLCLVVFAVLSLVSANAGFKLADRLAQRTAAYYAASQKGQQRLEELDRQLAALYENAREDAAAGEGAAAGGNASYRAACLSYLSSLDGTLAEDPETGDLLFSYQEKITQEQHLAVALSIPAQPEAGQPFYQINAWQTKASQAWEPDNSLNLMP